MKILMLLPVIFFSSFAFSNTPSSLNSLVFDLSDDLKTSLPEDGWVKLSFGVTNFGEKDLTIRFSAICVESGLKLPYYPQNIKLALKPGMEQAITVFMNDQCGQLSNLPVGNHNRTLRYTFVDLDTKEELAFDQLYVIEVPCKATSSAGY